MKKDDKGLGSGIISDPDINEKISVGKEFMEWAEKYWLLDKLVNPEKSDNSSGETCDYNYMREIFIEKINGIIKERLN